ncbi:hypothetical protein IT575_00085 [bacterium]|nr:hypothetical protein [bacterium]
MKHCPDMHIRPALSSIALFTAILLLLGACSGQGQREGLQPAAEQAALKLLPAPDMLRSASVQDIVQSGLDRIARHPQAGQKNSSLVLSAEGDDAFEWGAWAFGPLEDQPLELQIVVSQSGPDTSTAIVFLANFQRGSWDAALTQAFSTLDTLVVPIDPALHLSPENNVLVAVAVPAGEGIVGVSELRLRTDGDPVLEAKLSADVLQGEAPLLVQLDASDSTGNIVKFEWDTNGSGNFVTDTGTVPTLGSTYSSPGLFNAVVRVTDDTGSTSTDSIQIAVTQDGNLPPTASLVPDVFEGDGEAGFTVNLVAEASEDPEGPLSLFEWDLDGDTGTGTGGFEVSSSTPDNQQAQISSPGEKRLRLRVTDSGGLQNVVSVIITGRGWVQVPLETFNDGDRAAGLALTRIGKGPVVSYVDSNTNLLQFARSSREHGASPDDWALTDITVANDTKVTDVLEVDGRPAICFSGLDDSLGFTRSNSATGAAQADWEIVTADSVDALGMSMAIVDGRPGISYVERTNLGTVGLKFAFSSTTTGIEAADWDSITVKAADGQLQGFGRSTALLLVQGLPAIAWNSSIGSLSGRFVNFARSSTAAGSVEGDWEQTLALAECEDRGLSLALIDGRPAISFCAVNPAANTPSFLRSSSADGALLADWLAVKVGTSAEGGFNSRLAVIDGVPQMSFSRDFGADSQLALKLAESSSADGGLETDWLSQDQVTEPSQMAGGLTEHDMAVIDGYQALVFFDSTASQLTYAIRF